MAVKKDLLEQLEDILAQIDEQEDVSEVDETVDGEEQVDEDAAKPFNAVNAEQDTVANIRKSAKPQTPKRRMDKRNPEASKGTLSKAGMISAAFEMMKGMSKEEIAEMLGASEEASAAESDETVVTENTVSFEKKITKADLKIDEDIKALFSGDELSEEFKTKATEIFETVVVTAVNAKLAELSKELEEQFTKEIDETSVKLSEQVDQYLEYVVEQWGDENKLAIEAGIRNQIAESFMEGLKDLMAEHYIDIPEDKVDIAEELATENEKLNALLAEALKKSQESAAQVQDFLKIGIIDEVRGDLSESQVEKLCSLGESVEFVSEEDFKAKIIELKDKFFGTKTAVSEDKKEASSVEPLKEEVITEDKTNEVEITPEVASVVAALSKNAKTITLKTA